MHARFSPLKFMFSEHKILFRPIFDLEIPGSVYFKPTNFLVCYWHETRTVGICMYEIKFLICLLSRIKKGILSIGVLYLTCRTQILNQENPDNLKNRNFPDYLGFPVPADGYGHLIWIYWSKKISFTVTSSNKEYFSYQTRCSFSSSATGEPWNPPDYREF